MDDPTDVEVKAAGTVTTQTPSRGRRMSVRAALVAATVALAAPGAGMWLYHANAEKRFVPDPLLPRTTVPVIDIELGGSGQPWPAGGPPGLSAALGWDFVLVVGYGVGLVLGAVLARQVFWTPVARFFATAGLALAVVTVVADCVENILLLNAVHHTTRADGGWLLDAAAGFAVTKFVAIAVAAPVALLGVAVTLHRLVTWSRAGAKRPAIGVVPPPPLATDRGPTPAPGAALPATGDPADPTTLTTATRWRNGYEVPGLDEQDHGKKGICVSGGGIRSASVTLGALQTLRDRLLEARFLVSVSGGGYTAGGMQLALPRDGSPEPSVATPATVFAPGTVEEDHLRRHSSYLADGFAQWLVALGVALRGLLMSLLLLVLATVVLGLMVGLAYEAAPLVTFDLSDPDEAMPYPAPRVGALSAIAAIAGLAVLAWLVSVLDHSRRAIRSPFWTNATLALLGLASLVALLTVALPALVWAAAWTTHTAAESLKMKVGGAAGSVLLTYVAAVVAIWRGRETLKKQATAFQGPLKLVRRVLARFWQHAVVGLALAVVGTALLLLFGRIVATAGDWSLVRVGAAVALLVLACALIDQTELSLHPFYRRRLAAAFAVRPVRRSDGTVVALPYDYAREPTALDDYGVRHPPFPEVVFAAAANLSGQERTPPGARAVSFTFTSTWLGGPDVGYLGTKSLHENVSGTLQRDLTVQAAVAISGAAFASAMGRQTRAIQTLLALSNARLGAWLPNPAFVAQLRTDAAEHWSHPGIPSKRRLTYLLREIVGSYSCTDRLLLVTDGGHYENLGLVELLRRRCREIVCIDASGDAPPTMGTLSDSIQLAYDELGVRICFEGDLGGDPWALTPGTAAPPATAPGLESLTARLARDNVLVGTVTYPPESGLPEGQREGVVVVAKALLTPASAYDLQSYAARHREFPNDGTADQWFDAGQFTAYTALGRELGLRVEALLDERERATRHPSLPEQPTGTPAGARPR